MFVYNYHKKPARYISIILSPGVLFYKQDNWSYNLFGKTQEFLAHICTIHM